MASSGPPVFREERMPKKLKGSKHVRPRDLLSPNIIWVRSVAISPDGTLAATTGKNDFSFVMYEVASWTPVYSFHSRDEPAHCVWSPDGMRLWVPTQNGPILEVSRVSGQWSHGLVFEHKTTVMKLMYLPAFDLLVLPCHDKRLLIVDVAAGYKTIQALPLKVMPTCAVSNASGSLLLIGGHDGLLSVFARNRSGAYDKVDEVTLLPEESSIRALSLSANGSLLLVSVWGGTTSLWRVAWPWSSFDTVPIKCMRNFHSVFWAAFSGDEQFVLTGSYDDGIRIWRISDAQVVGRIQCDGSVNTIAFHAATGTLAVAILKRGVAIYRCDPGELVLPPKADSMFDRRVRRPLAESDLAVVKEHIATFDASVYAACDKERGLLADIERLTEQLAAAQKDLASLRTADFIKQRDELAKLLAQERALESEISSHDHVLRELEENTKTLNCLDNLRGDGFEQWLHDVGLGHVHSRLKEVDGALLATLLVADLEAYGLSFADSCALLLRGYITQHQLSAAPHFVPPPGLLLWDAKTTSAWLSTHGGEFAAISSLGWTGACLCSLNASRVRGLLGPDSFAQLCRMVHDQLASEDAPEWVQKWSASNAEYALCMLNESSAPRMEEANNVV